ncbi:pyridoxamine 5'-phosphate oxidase [Sphingomonas sp. Root710]|uniref:MSMEG_1061 family FMN-dependent PPOX-type flavoprotein n=1 Tax=Sphingomonas sp. Root710 TaxID=1736594 RepID=UPI0006FC99B7|nr:MSMEG_1061 family FMN-dependent PPOX-type flavoprotein [Sphingomonas sp. Root710]KRB79890.1 pyridoxamine 5'-phosphate oxidase [Sphingomonas sp. Root710]
MDRDIAYLNDAELSALYAPPGDLVQRAVRSHLTDFHLEYLRSATFFILATGSSNGLDASPRGGAAGIVQTIDRETVCFADWPGNNRIESLRNIVRDDRVGLLFIFPGLDIFMRINGRAGVTVDGEILDRLKEGTRRPKTAVVVRIDDVLFHCGKAVNRAGLWKADSQLDRKAFPSPGVMMKELAEVTDVPAEDLDAGYSHAMVNDLYGEPEH